MEAEAKLVNVQSLLDALNWIAQDQGISVDEAVRQSVAVNQHLLQKKRDGASVLIHHEGKITEFMHKQPQLTKPLPPDPESALTLAQSAQSTEVGVVVLFSSEDLYWYVYPIATFNQMAEEEGDWAESVDSDEALAEPGSLHELVALCQQNNWLVVNSAEGNSY